MTGEPRQTGPPRHCVCGCGRGVQIHVQSADDVAIELIPELLAWDRLRARMRAGESWPDSPVTLESLDAFLEEGGEHYRHAVAIVHGEKPFTAIGLGANRWLRYSRRSRRKLAELAPGAIDPARRHVVADDELAQLDRHHPERSFTG